MILGKFVNRNDEWITTLGCQSNNSQCGGLAIDRLHNLYVVGYTECGIIQAPNNFCQPPVSATGEFSICPPTNQFFQETSAGNGTPRFGGWQDGFIYAFNSSNQMTWGTYLGGRFSERIYNAHYDAKFDRLYVTGLSSTRSNGNMPLVDPNTNNYQQNIMAGSFNSFIGRLGLDLGSTIGIEPNLLDEKFFNIYPNPATDKLIIEFQLKDGVVMLYNMLGQEIQSNQLVSGENNMNLELLASGVYVVRILTEQGEFSQKIVKQ